MRISKIQLKFLFDFVAGFYDYLELLSVARWTRSSAFESLNHLNINGKSILDMGCGTGNWSKILYDQGGRVVGFDYSTKMIKYAQIRQNPEIFFYQDDVMNIDKIPSDSYQLISAAFVLHGFSHQQRMWILQQINRICREGVIVFDFYKKIPWIAELIEIFEGSHYTDFIQNFQHELRDIFPLTRVYNLNYGGGLYCGFKT